MTNWLSIRGFDWDDGNARKNEAAHGVSQAEAEQVFMNEPLIVATDHQHSREEERFHALGRTNDGRLLHVTFTIRGNGALLRVISARDMSRRERRVYEEAP